MPKNNTQDTKLQNNLSQIHHTIIIMSGKGGVGKSTVAANLALALSTKGHNTGLLDSDIHGPTIPKILGIENHKPTATNNNLNPIQAHPHLKVMSMGFLLQNQDTPVIWRGPMKMTAIKQLLGDFNWGPLDYLIIDLPPGTGDEPLSIAQLIPHSDGAIIITTPQDVALVSVRKSINFVKKMQIPILGIIENMSGFTCPHCHKPINIFKTGGGKTIAHDFNLPLLGTIPLDPNIVTSGDSGIPYLTTHTNTPAGKAYTKIVNNLENSLKNKGKS